MWWTSRTQTPKRQQVTSRNTFLKLRLVLNTSKKGDLNDVGLSLGIGRTRRRSPSKERWTTLGYGENGSPLATPTKMWQWVAEQLVSLLWLSILAISWLSRFRNGTGNGL